MAAGALRDLPSAPCQHQAGRRCGLTLGKRKQTVSSTVRSSGCREQRGTSSLVGSPGTATSASRNLAHCGSLSPGLCWLLVKKSHSPPTAPSKPSQSPALLLGHKEKVMRQETAICEVIGTIKPETRRTDRR